jgi:Tol biopolymer transport system component
MKAKEILNFMFVMILFISCKKNENVSDQNSPCDVVKISHNPNYPIFWSPDKSKFFISKQDSAGVFQIYVGNAGDTTLTDISSAHINGNCCGLYRHWSLRNKLQVQWHPSGNYIICVVEKEFYPELLYTPYSLRLGLLQSGIWMDVWAVTPNGSNWYNLATTEHGVTGPAFTPDGSKAAWAEGLNGSNLAVDIFGKWKLQLSNFSVSNGTPSFSTTNNISPQGARWLEPGNFSPDGRSLLISSDIGMINAEGQDQYILDIITGQVTNLNNSPKIWDEHGFFSPDGEKILFMSSYPYRADTNSYHTLSIKTDFMLMNKDGSGLQQLTHFRTPGYPESSPGIASTGFWTPDGTTIYAQSLIFPDFDNWIIKFNGSCGK